MVLEIGGGWKGGFDEFAGDADRVVGLRVEVAADDAEDGGGEVGGCVEDIWTVEYLGTVKSAPTHNGVIGSSGLDLTKKRLPVACFGVRRDLGCFARINFVVDKD